MSPSQMAQYRGGVVGAVAGAGLDGFGDGVEDGRGVAREPEQRVGLLLGGELADPLHAVVGGDRVAGRNPLAARDGLGQTGTHGWSFH